VGKVIIGMVLLESVLKSLVGEEGVELKTE